MRSETFPFAERFAVGISPLGTLAYFDTRPEPAAPASASGRSAARKPAAPAPSPTPPILLLHALGLNYTQWELVAPELARLTRVVGVDTLGCGHSARPTEPYGLAEITESVCRLIDHLGLERPIIVGHSFGGRIAMEVALRRPGRVSGLVLLNSAGLTNYPAFFETVGRRILRPSLVGTLMIGVAPLFMGRIFGKKTERSERFLKQIMQRAEAGFVYDLANHACPMLSDLVSTVVDRLPELTLPVHVIWGDRDALMAFKNVEDALRRLPDVTIQRLPDCGHMPNLEHPEVVIAAARRLLDRVTTRATDGTLPHAGAEGSPARPAAAHSR